MGEEFYTILTKAGKALVADSIANGTDINLSAVAVGDVDHTPDENQTALLRERARLPITEILFDNDNPAWLRVSTLIPPAVGGWNIYEAGLFTKTGVLFALAKLDGAFKPLYPSGMTKEVALDIILEISSEANVNLTVDPHVVIATREWVKQYYWSQAVTIFGYGLNTEGELIITKATGDNEYLDVKDYQSLATLPVSTTYTLTDAGDLIMHLPVRGV